MEPKGSIPYPRACAQGGHREARMHGCAYTHAHNRARPASPACADPGHSSFLRLPKTNRFVLVFTEMLCVLRPCLSHSAGCRCPWRASHPQAALVSPWPLVAWPSLHPHRGSPDPVLTGQRSSLPISIRADIRHATLLRASPLQSRP